jgi:hypothetical protein
MIEFTDTVECPNGTVIVITTTCQPGETIQECADRHRLAVERAKASCGDA